MIEVDKDIKWLFYKGYEIQINMKKQLEMDGNLYWQLLEAIPEEVRHHVRAILRVKYLMVAFT